MKKISELYLTVLGNKVGIALLCVFPFLLLNKNVFFELYFEAFIIFFASFITAKRFTKKECLHFALLYLTFFFILETGTLIYGLTNSAFGSITIIYYGKTILLSLGVKILIWFFIGGFIFYLINLITVKAVTEFEKIFLPVRKIFTNPLNVVFCGITIFILMFAYNGIFINVKSLSFPANLDYTIKTTLDNEKLLLFSSNENKLAIYNVKDGEFITNCPNLKQKPNGFSKAFKDIDFKKMPNGNIFIRKFYVKKDDKTQRKTIAYIYSPSENKLIYEEELPDKIAFYQTAMVFYDNENAFCAGADSDKKSYIYNIKDKTLKEAAETKQKRRGCELLPLKNKKIFIWGGYSDDYKSAELYDIKNNEITEMPINFILYFNYGKDKLNLLEDGTVLIKTTKLEENESDGIGNYVSGQGGTGYPIPYFVKYNPNDNSFNGFVPDKKQKYQFSNYDSTVTNNGKIIITGGSLVNRIKKRTSEYNNKIFVYDIKSNKLYKTYTYNFPITLEPTVFALNNKEVVVYFNPPLGTKNPDKYLYKKIKFFII